MTVGDTAVYQNVQLLIKVGLPNHSRFPPGCGRGRDRDGGFPSSETLFGVVSCMGEGGRQRLKETSYEHKRFTA